MSKKELIAFEEKISTLYKEAKIKAPVHLSKGNEDQLISIFKNIREEDWVFSNWRNHYHALLKGICPERLERDILEGRSMHITSKEHNFFSSSLVGGNLPIALGVAMALKQKKSKNNVWAFCGDMTSETGVFHELLEKILPLFFQHKIPCQQPFPHHQESEAYESLIKQALIFFPYRL